MPRRLSLVAVLVCAATLLSACQPSLKGKAASDMNANAVTGDPIEVTALDAPAGTAAPPATGTEATKPAGRDTSATPAAPESAVPVAAAATATPAPRPDLAATPVTPKSEMQLACEKKRGKWTKVGKGDLRACVFTTRDGGKSCQRESQCDGVCLARSGTCSPIKPLYGCNEILQDNGARVKLCLD